MKNHILLFIASSTFLFSCSGEIESGKEKSKTDTVSQNELDIEINNSDWVIMATDSTLKEIDFTNFSYLLEEGTSVTVINGESYKNDSIGFDSVFIVHESLRSTINQNETKIIELERHYGFGSSTLMNYIFAFQIIDKKLQLTGSLKYEPRKRANFDGPVLSIYPTWTERDKNDEPQLVKSLVQAKQGNFEVIKSEKE